MWYSPNGCLLYTSKIPLVPCNTKEPCSNGTRIFIARNTQVWTHSKDGETRKRIDLTSCPNTPTVWEIARVISWTFGRRFIATPTCKAVLSGTGSVSYTHLLEIYRWSTGSYLECQDFWRISGIERDVYLFAQSPVYLRDFAIRQDLDSTYKNGIFGLDLCLTNANPRQPGQVTVSYQLENPSGTRVAEGNRTIKIDSTGTVHFDAKIPQVAAWTAETPNLYQLFIRIEQPGKTAEIIPFRVGFRKLEIRGNQFLVNGRAVLIKGINYHEHNEQTGHVLSETDMRKDCLLYTSRCV